MKNENKNEIPIIEDLLKESNDELIRIFSYT